MDAFSMAGESNLVFIINELDKDNSGKGTGNPADVLLTLLDNLGFTDNYMECMIPTVVVYPIATANDKSQISSPLMSRFAVIDIPDYTPEEKKAIFSKFALPKVLKRIGLREGECIMTDDALDAVIDIFSDTTGIRDLEQTIFFSPKHLFISNYFTITFVASPAPAEEVTEEVEEEDSDEMKLTSLQSITDFMTCAVRTLPDNIRLWARKLNVNMMFAKPF